MGDPSYWRMSATELLAGYARHDFSPVEVVRELFERVDRLNLKRSSFLARNPDDALPESAADRSLSARTGGDDQSPAGSLS